MKATINTSLLPKLTPRSKPYEVRDDKLTGFLVRVNISGKLMYMCEYARGKRVTIGKAGVLTPTQARDRAHIILGDAAKGVDPKAGASKKGGITVQDFIMNHYQPWAIEHRKVGAKSVKHIERCFIKKTFGQKPLTELTPSMIDQWRTQRLKAGKSTETVNRDIATFKAAISKAVLWGLIDKHPLEKLKLLKSDRSSKIRYLTTDEETKLRKFLIQRDNKFKEGRANANKWRKKREYELLPDLSGITYTDHMHPMILLSMNTGLRRGELFSLLWSNVNLERGTLTIEGSYAKSGKTRHIPLNSEAITVLKLWQGQTSNSGLVFCNNNGVRFGSIKTSWRTIVNGAKIKNFRWHDLRHHFASRLVMAGVDLNTVRELLGHGDMLMTLRYAHLAPEHKALAVEKLIKSQPSCP